MRTEITILLYCIFPGILPVYGGTLDLTHATVVRPAKLSTPEAKAVEMLIDEVEKRSQIRWQSLTEWPSDEDPVIVVGQEDSIRPLAADYVDALRQPAEGAEGYRVQIVRNAVLVVGNDQRGVLFGVGGLLRSLRMGRGQVSLRDELSITTAPMVSLRGHQLGYRPKTNSYDAWTLPMWEQYIRDLVVFGTNAVELIPPRSDDADESPHFPKPKMEMMIGMSQLLADYGLDVWVWYPALDRDYSDSETVAFALREWGEVFRKLPRIDAVNVPGGDPGRTPPTELMALMEKQTAVLQKYHPQARMWIAPQFGDQENMEEFFKILNTEPEWLGGVIHASHMPVTLAQLRALTPKRYPIRSYPDTTHTIVAQYPVPDWDPAYAATEAREPINPRPVDTARLFHFQQPHMLGFVNYSEGCNDDVNKFIWSALGWNPQAEVIDILREYSRYFVGETYTDRFAQGLLALERNWRGPLLTTEGVYGTLQQFQTMEKSASPQTLLNWRFQQALYRAYYDAYTRSRLLYETALEDRAVGLLREAESLGSFTAMQGAEFVLEKANTDRVSQDWRARVFELAEALYQSIRMQLSVSRYKAISVSRGANLDNIDVPLNNSAWLKGRFSEIRELSTEEERLQAIGQIVNWTNPGPGGFYDDLGNPSNQPHLVRGVGPERDPGFLESALLSYGSYSNTEFRSWRKSWVSHAQSSYGRPLEMHYTDLDPSAQYKIRITYGSRISAMRPPAGMDPERLAMWEQYVRDRHVHLLADRQYEVHGFRPMDPPWQPVEFDIPREATRDGDLRLSWETRKGSQNLGGGGRFELQVSEVWLIREPDE